MAGPGEDFLTGGGVPELYLARTGPAEYPWADPPLGGAGHALAVGAERHAADGAAMTLEGEDCLPRRGVPDLDRHVLRGAGQAFAVGAEGHTRNRANVPLQGKGSPAGDGVQDCQCLSTPPTGGEAFAVGTERHALDAVDVIEGQHLLCRGCLPHPDRLPAG